MGTGRVNMGWRLRVVHITRVSYAAPVRTLFNEARMTPLTLPSQTTLESRVTIGGAVPVWTYCDYWGSFVSVFDLPGPCSDLVITARSTVETEPAAPRPVPASIPAWTELRERATGGRLLEFLLATALTTLESSVTEPLLEELRGTDPLETAVMIAARVRERVSYMAGSTGVRTNAQQAWDQGQGVCQDIAHVTVGLLRAAGIPARYVSGYLHADPSAEPGHTVAGQSHAWVEYWAGTWVPCDPTNDASVGERHVVVARGRDYADVPPLKGIYHGPPDSILDVTVEVTRLA
ncbi:MAG TPA: transglutaminase family protein [Streptosporangiaceae bacterium]